MGTVTKKGLTQAIAESTGMKKNLVYQMVDCLFETMRESLIDGNRIEIRGFSVLETKATKPKPKARNPRTGEIIYVPGRRKTHFRPGKVLKEAMCEVGE